VAESNGCAAALVHGEGKNKGEPTPAAGAALVATSLRDCAPYRNGKAALVAAENRDKSERLVSNDTIPGGSAAARLRRVSERRANPGSGRT